MNDVVPDGGVLNSSNMWGARRGHVSRGHIMSLGIREAAAAAAAWPLLGALPT